MRCARRLLHRRPLLAVSCGAAVTVGHVRRSQCACGEPEAEPEFVPSAPALRADEDPTGRPPPFNPEFVANITRSFLQSSEGRALVETAVANALRRAAADEAAKAEEKMRRVRLAEEAAFQGQVRKCAGEAAAAAAQSEVARLRSLIEAVAATVVQKETERAVPLAVREDPLMKRLLAEQLRDVRAEVRRAAEKELAEICDEERHQRVNRAFLAALERRAQEVIDGTEKRVERSVQNARQPLLVAQALGAVALVTAIAGLLVPRARL